MPVNQATYNKRLLEILGELIKLVPVGAMQTKLARELKELQRDQWQMEWDK